MCPSTGFVGDCYDNAMCESFFATHKEARLAIFSYIEGWYNPQRRHSSFAYQAPMAYEACAVMNIYGKLHQSQA